MRFFLHIDNNEKDILIFDEGATQEFINYRKNVFG